MKERGILAMRRTEAEGAEAEGETGLVEMRLDALQVLMLDRALGKMPGNACLRSSWYRLSLEHRGELMAGKPVTFALPGLPGLLPSGFGKAPEIRAEWLPVFIHALEKDGQQRLAGLLRVVYQAIAWGLAEEIYFYDGIFDLATISGRKRLLRREMVMREMRGLPALPEAGAQAVPERGL